VRSALEEGRPSEEERLWSEESHQRDASGRVGRLQAMLQDEAGVRVATPPNNPA
jgi:hypothetical protein